MTWGAVYPSPACGTGASAGQNSRPHGVRHAAVPLRACGSSRALGSPARRRGSGSPISWSFSHPPHIRRPTPGALRPRVLWPPSRCRSIVADCRRTSSPGRRPDRRRAWSGEVDRCAGGRRPAARPLPLLRAALRRAGRRWRRAGAGSEPAGAPCPPRSSSSRPPARMDVPRMSPSVIWSPPTSRVGGPSVSEFVRDEATLRSCGVPRAPLGHQFKEAAAHVVVPRLRASPSSGWSASRRASTR